MAFNGISTEVYGDGSDPIATKLLRRADKLALASAKRGVQDTPGYRAYHTIIGTHQAYVNGTNGATLTSVSGTTSPTAVHPWSLFQIGLQRTIYNGYFGNVDYIPNGDPPVAGNPNDDDVTWFMNNPGSIESVALDTSIVLEDTAMYRSFEWTGYFLAQETTTYTFYTNSDDASYFWLGDDALAGYTTYNALVNNGGLHGMVEWSGTVDLVAGNYYPIRLQFGQNGGGEGLELSYSTNTVSKTSDFTGLLFFGPFPAVTYLGTEDGDLIVSDDGLYVLGT